MVIIRVGSRPAWSGQAVAVGVVGVSGNNDAVLFDFFESACGVIGVLVGGGDTTKGFDFLGDAAQLVARVADIKSRCPIDRSRVVLGFAKAVVGVGVKSLKRKAARATTVLFLVI